MATHMTGIWARKIHRIGNSLGITLPKEIVNHMRVKEGETVHVVMEPDGSVRLSVYDPAFDATVKAFERTRSKYRKTLRELAK